ncbi:MAG: hypothetical protein JXR83_03375 [Deltaproteobacteria bacterium]|nr:hypothetical protein [Deltaproteobacteria bacterium]
MRFLTPALLLAAMACQAPTPATPCAAASDCPPGHLCDAFYGYCIAAAGRDGGAADRLHLDAALRDSAIDTASPDAAGPPLQIFRSVGPNNRAPLASHSGSLSVYSGVANIAPGPGDRIGVGDILAYSAYSGGGYDTAAMIVRRISATSYEVRTMDGDSAPDTSSDTTMWKIFRAHTSLAEALRGDLNSGLQSLGLTLPPETGDLVGSNRVLNILCYADAVDTESASLGEVTTSPVHRVRIYTPHLASEVGVSQRHAGTWSESVYTIRNNFSEDILVSADHVTIEGLQIDVVDTGGYNVGVSVYAVGAGARIEVLGCIFRGDGAASGPEYIAAEIWESNEGATLRLANNLIYGMGGGFESACAICAFSSRIEAYHNTIVDAPIGAQVVLPCPGILAINNLFADCDRPADGRFIDGTDYNATTSANLGYVTTTSPSHDRVGQVFGFVAATACNFHLTAGDSGARNAGSTLPQVTTDIDGQPRTVPRDIGADEVE